MLAARVIARVVSRLHSVSHRSRRVPIAPRSVPHSPTSGPHHSSTPPTSSQIAGAPLPATICCNCFQNSSCTFAFHATKNMQQCQLPLLSGNFSGCHESVPSLDSTEQRNEDIIISVVAAAIFLVVVYCTCCINFIVRHRCAIADTQRRRERRRSTINRAMSQRLLNLNAAGEEEDDDDASIATMESRVEAELRTWEGVNESSSGWCIMAVFASNGALFVAVVAIGVLILSIQLNFIKSYDSVSFHTLLCPITLFNTVSGTQLSWLVLSDAQTSHCEIGFEAIYFIVSVLIIYQLVSVPWRACGMWYGTARMTYAAALWYAFTHQFWCCVWLKRCCLDGVDAASR